MNTSRYIWITILHTLIGGLLGYFILHPVSMLISKLVKHITVLYWETFIESFTLDHFNMVVYFIILGCIAGFIYGLYARRNKILFEEEKALAIFDRVTSIFNHRYVMNRLREEIERAKRYTNPQLKIDQDLED